MYSCELLGRNCLSPRSLFVESRIHGIMCINPRSKNKYYFKRKEERYPEGEVGNHMIYL